MILSISLADSIYFIRKEGSERAGEDEGASLISHFRSELAVAHPHFPGARICRRCLLELFLPALPSATFPDITKRLSGPSQLSWEPARPPGADFVRLGPEQLSEPAALSAVGRLLRSAF